MQRIDSVVFDIGRVLVDLDFGRLLAFFADHGVDVAQVGDILQRIDLAAYERGEFDGDALLRRIAGLGSRPMPLAAVRERWNDIFVPQPQMLALLHEVATRHRVFLLSNIGDLHWEHLQETLGVGSLGHGALPSFRAGVSKPDPAIYERAESVFGLSPAATVFIDDLEENVMAARRRGWHAIQHRSHSATIAELRRLGIAA